MSKTLLGSRNDLKMWERSPECPHDKRDISSVCFVVELLTCWCVFLILGLAHLSTSSLLNSLLLGLSSGFPASSGQGEKGRDLFTCSFFHCQATCDDMF